jgi:hypothetical protein
MNQFAPYIAPALALVLILRRGSKPRRVKVNSLWRYPIIITVLSVSTLLGKPFPGLLPLAMFAAAIPAGAAVGWFSAQHVELTLDSATGTITSKPTAFGTALTAGAFIARFAVEYLMKGGIGSGAPSPPFAFHHATTWVGAADALLLFVAARGLASAWHMWIRTRPLLEQHKAVQLETPGKS